MNAWHWRAVFYATFLIGCVMTVWPPYARNGEPAWWKDLEIIRDQLQRVTNNSRTNRGGGGTPRVPLASHPRRD